MKVLKIIGVAIGIALVVGGIYCLITPVETFGALGWLIGFIMMVEGVSSVFTWNERRRIGFADGWTLAGAIISIILGAFVIGSMAIQFAIDAFLAYLVAFWLVLSGVARIVAAFSLRKIQRAGNDVGTNWVLLLLLGALIVAMGVACFLHPAFAMAGVGIILGIAVIITGCSIVVTSVTS
ncbi:MAG: DUF308 domain-containing protein [Eggerthellaceae bacterium]|nr:DUF308 domain-containing protein [Eggerthellaceae bacterium]